MVEKAREKVRKPPGGRLAAVTGASSGIGAAFARRLARDGYDLVVVARRLDRLEQLARSLRARNGVTVEVLPADLTDAKSLGAVEETVRTDERLEILINNAGFGTAGRFWTLDPDRQEEEIRLNVVALMRLTRAALPGMIARGRGSIVNVSSLAAFQPGPLMATYSATKAFVNAFTESLCEELRGTGVRVQALCPGFTRTEFQQRAGVNTAKLPPLVWMSADQVAEASLAAMRRGDVICIPGWKNWLATSASSALPRAWVRRAMGIIAKRYAG